MMQVTLRLAVEFCAIYEPTTYRIARKCGLQDADAREVTQEVLLLVSRKIQGFDLSRDGRFRGWLARIARNATIDLLRRRKATTVGGSEFARRVADIPFASANDEAAEFEIEARRQQFRWAGRSSASSGQRENLAGFLAISRRR